MNFSNPFKCGLSGLTLLLEDSDEVTSRAGGGNVVERSWPSQLNALFFLVDGTRPNLVLGFFISGGEFSAPEVGGVMYAFWPLRDWSDSFFLLSFRNKFGLCGRWVESDESECDCVFSRK